MTVWGVLLRRHTDRDTSAMEVSFSFGPLYFVRIILAATFGYPGNILTPTPVPIASSLASVLIASRPAQLTPAITGFIGNIIPITSPSSPRHQQHRRPSETTSPHFSHSPRVFHASNHYMHFATADVLIITSYRATFLLSESDASCTRFLMVNVDTRIGLADVISSLDQ